jgi:hypothetical protein
MHSGGATGGHYYAYIQDIASKKWFRFDDASISPIDDADVRSRVLVAPGHRAHGPAFGAGTRNAAGGARRCEGRRRFRDGGGGCAGCG